jgi:LemA protein
VIEARAKATSIQVDAKDLTPENMKKFEDAQSGLSGALSRLMVVSENYPELKANAAFMALQGQLEGTENRITVERKKFNESVQDYNTTILTFPNNLTSGMFGFTKRAYFEAKAGAENTPEVKF